ncbi:hypothetical protein [Aquimarina algiphila]|uniref:hypothetical protein n=1 Tax=Aquimarina algiphila TaxID=2047982 RepID=UPI00232D5FFB|nr:hypothetical protein [Aquimarina algiphila]
MIFYSIVFFIGGFYTNYLNQLQSAPFILGSFLLLITIIIYFTELLKTDQIIEITKDLLSWISGGLLMYYVGITPFRIVREYYATQSDSLVLFLITIILTIIMNTCFIIGFIISSKSNMNT